MWNIPEAFANAGYFKSLDGPLWYVAMGLTYISGIIFFVRTSRAEAKVSKQWYLAFALFSFFYATTRLFFNLAVEFGYAIIDDGEVYDFWCSLGYISAIAGAIYLLYVAETNIITSTRKLCTIMLVVGIVAAILGVILRAREISLIITYAVSLLATVLILFIYIVMIRNSTGALRKKTIGAFVGIVIWFLAIILDGEVAYKTIMGMPLLLPPLMYIVGVTLYTIFQRAG